MRKTNSKTNILVQQSYNYEKMEKTFYQTKDY